MWVPAFGGGQCGRKPPHNCGASPTPRAGLEAVPLPLGLAQPSWDPLKWVPGKSCPRGLGVGWSLWEGRGLRPTHGGRLHRRRLHRRCRLGSRLPPGFRGLFLPPPAPGYHPSFLLAFVSSFGRILLPFQTPLRLAYSQKPPLRHPGPLAFLPSLIASR